MMADATCAGTDTPLAGACVAVVGAGAGVGRTLARRLRGAGARVAAFDQLGVCLQDLQHDPGAAALHMAVLDVGDPQAVALGLSAAERMLGSIHHLVCALDARAPGRLTDMASAHWREVFDINVMGALHFSQAAARQMRRRRQGMIIHLGATGADVLQPEMSAYAASMAALAPLSAGLAAELEAQGVSCRYVAGATESAATTAVLRLLCSAGVAAS